MNNKEKQINTQSSLKFVLEWSKTCDKCLSLKDIVSITNVITDYVEQGWSTDLGKRLDKIEEHINNKD